MDVSDDSGRRQMKAEQSTRQKTKRKPAPDRKPPPNTGAAQATSDHVQTAPRLTIRLTREVNFEPNDYDLIILPFSQRDIRAEYKRHPMFKDQRLYDDVVAETSKFERPFAVVRDGNLLMVAAATSSKFYPEALALAVAHQVRAASGPKLRIYDGMDYTNPGAYPLADHLAHLVESTSGVQAPILCDVCLTAPSVKALQSSLPSQSTDTGSPFSPANLSIKNFEGGELFGEPGSGPGSPNRQSDTRTQFLADHATHEDLLGYHPYAMGIASFVKDKGTALPLTIAIDGAWGKGKSSLMKMLRNELDPKRPKDGDVLPRLGWFKQMLESLRAPFKILSTLALSFVARTPNIPAESGERRFVTVFVNAWRHGKGTELKAKMVSDILTAMTNRFGPDFLLRLQMKRLDRIGLLETAAKSLLTNGLVFGAVLILSLLLLGTIWLNLDFSFLPQAWTTFAAAQPEETSLGIFVVNALLIAWKSRPSLALDDYLQAPNYAELAGDDAAVEADFRRILAALEERNCHLALFVDDLDRCSPNECAQVVEALNTFFGGDGHQCLFVLGMHRELVASSLDVAYKDLVEQIGTNALLAEQRPFGRRFLEKIVQFTVALPEPDENATEEFLDALTAEGKRGSIEDIKALARAQEHEQASERLAQSGQKPSLRSRLNEMAPMILNDLLSFIFPWASRDLVSVATDTIIERMEKKGVNVELAKQEAVQITELKERIVARKNANENEYVDAFKQVKNVIRANPRQYKRFFNKLRFYRLLNVGEANPMLVDACEAVLALEHPNLYYRITKTTGTFHALAKRGKGRGKKPEDIANLLQAVDDKPGLKELREVLASV